MCLSPVLFPLFQFLARLFQHQAGVVAGFTDEIVGLLGRVFADIGDKQPQVLDDAFQFRFAMGHDISLSCDAAKSLRRLSYHCFHPRAPLPVARTAQAAKPCELDWGSHEKHFPEDGGQHDFATGLQVTIAALAGMVWALENPERGVVEPDDMDLDDPWQFKNFRVR